MITHEDIYCSTQRGKADMPLLPETPIVHDKDIWELLPENMWENIFLAQGFSSRTDTAFGHSLDPEDLKKFQSPEAAYEYCDNQNYDIIKSNTAVILEMIGKGDPLREAYAQTVAQVYTRAAITGYFYEGGLGGGGGFSFGPISTPDLVLLEVGLLDVTGNEKTFQDILTTSLNEYQRVVDMHKGRNKEARVNRYYWDKVINLIGDELDLEASTWTIKLN